MPNTLVHIALQVPATRALTRRIGVGWLLLGCVIPDIPWILRRIVGMVSANVNSYDLMAYATVQASWLFCVVLSISFACLARRPVIIAAVLTSNCLVHLLMDAVEIKPGNGVHLFAPWSWELFSLGWLWPENLAIMIFSGLGLALGVWLIRAQPQRLDFISNRVAARALLSGLVLLIYLVGPLAFVRGPHDADNHSVRTLREADQRVGRTVRLDRQAYFINDDSHYLVTYAGEKIRLDGPPLARAGRVSVTGTFVETDMIRVTDLHANQAIFRDYASLAGLLIVLTVWLQSFRARHVT